MFKQITPERIMPIFSHSNIKRKGLVIGEATYILFMLAEKLRDIRLDGVRV